MDVCLYVVCVCLCFKWQHKKRNETKQKNILQFSQNQKLSLLREKLLGAVVATLYRFGHLSFRHIHIDIIVVCSSNMSPAERRAYSILFIHRHKAIRHLSHHLQLNERAFETLMVVSETICFTFFFCFLHLLYFIHLHTQFICNNDEPIHTTKTPTSHHFLFA